MKINRKKLFFRNIYKNVFIIYAIIDKQILKIKIKANKIKMRQFSICFINFIS